VTEPVETSPAPVGVEWKVKAATAASYVGGVVALFVLHLLSDDTFVTTYSSYLPVGVSTFVLPLLPAVITFGAAYITKHTPRSAGISPEVDAIVARVVAEVENRVEERLRERSAAPTASTMTHNRTGDL